MSGTLSTAFAIVGAHDFSPTMLQWNFYTLLHFPFVAWLYFSDCTVKVLGFSSFTGETVGYNLHTLHGLEMTWRGSWQRYDSWEIQMVYHYQSDIAERKPQSSNACRIDLHTYTEKRISPVLIATTICPCPSAVNRLPPTPPM